MNSESENPALSIPQAPSCYDAALTDGDVLSKSTSGLTGRLVLLLQTLQQGCCLARVCHGPAKWSL